MTVTEETNLIEIINTCTSGEIHDKARRLLLSGFETD